MEEHDSGCEFVNEDVVVRGGARGGRKIGSDRKTMLINTNDDLVKIAEELYSKDLEKCKENQLSVRDKGGGGASDLRRHSSGYYSTTSDQPLENGAGASSVVTKKDSTGYSHIRPRVDTGLKKATSIAGSTLSR